MNLPETFLENMKLLLGDEYDTWLSCYNEKTQNGLRINTSKITPSQWEGISPYGTQLVPWTKNGYYVEEDLKPSRDSYYYAGLYYLQEPSAMAPAQILPVKPGDKVLDLCAAPGGKSTELGARLLGEGLLVANDISNSRAKALLKNLELFGIPNICVTSETPDKLADTFGQFFDGILVDAPCSGEGMFRKDKDLIKSWESKGPEYYIPIQREILTQAVGMLKPGGHLLYSTCTFAPGEDEENITWLLEKNPQLTLVPIPLWEGACSGLDEMPAVRLFPHKVKGEGHFLALIQKKKEGEGPETISRPASTVDKQLKAFETESDFLSWEACLAHSLDRNRLMIKNNLVYYLPVDFNRSWNLRYLRTGLLVGEWKKKQFEPSQAMAMVLQKKEFSNVLCLSHEDERVIRYLKGETIFLKDEEQLKKGWTLVCVDEYPLGWGKYTGNNLKNKYYSGWRWQ